MTWRHTLHAPFIGLQCPKCGDINEKDAVKCEGCDTGLLKRIDGPRKKEK